jgi:hypothetical protein
VVSVNAGVRQGLQHRFHLIDDAVTGPQVVVDAADATGRDRCGGGSFLKDFMGMSVVSVVYNPATEEFFDASAGGGARLNGAPIQVSAPTRFGCGFTCSLTISPTSCARRRYHGRWRAGR